MNEIIEELFESRAMRDHLIKRAGRLTTHDWMSIICSAPVAIQRKAVLLSKLMKNKEMAAACTVRIALAQRAIEDLQALPGEVFLVRSCWYDTDYLENNERPLGLFLSFEKAMAGITQEMQDEGWSGADRNVTCWYEIEKWCPDGAGNLRKRIRFIFAGGVLMFFDGYEAEALPPGTDFAPYADLNISTPFQTGDRICVDCRPFAPGKTLLVLENNHPEDCCSLQGLCMDEEGLIRCGAVKHVSLFSRHYRPMLSPLYRADRMETPFEGDERILKKVREYIGSDPAKGREILDYVRDCCNEGSGVIPKTLETFLEQK